MKWGRVKRIQKAFQNSTSAPAYHASRHCERTPWSSFLSPSNSRRMHEQVRETVTNYLGSLSPTTAAHGKALANLNRRSCTEPHLWNTMSKPRMTRELSTFLHLKNCSGSLIGYSMVVSGKASFSSQARAVAETLKQEGSPGAKLAMDSRKFGQKKSEAMLMYLVAMVVAMVGMTYAAVPLYRKFCQATGYGGTVQRRETVEEKIARHKAEESAAVRELVVQFNADVADGMPWKFTPSQREVRVRPGQSTLAFYTAENNSNTPITGVSTYNVAPMKAGIYFNKIQCFCFEEQRLLPGEKIDMPVFFYIDPEFATDPKMDGINNLILSYTFFKVEDAPQQT